MIKMGLKNFFYTRIENKVVHLQSNLSVFMSSKDIESYLNKPYFFEKLDIEKQKDIEDWVNIINDAYDDTSYSFEEGEKNLSMHLFLKDIETFFISNEIERVATVSIGIYKQNPQVGGEFRIAVRRKYQGNGFGWILILYAFAKLKERGIKYGESIIASKRETSIYLHLKIGFVPQYDERYISYNKHLKNVNCIQRWKLKRRLKHLHKVYASNNRKNYEIKNV